MSPAAGKATSSTIKVSSGTVVVALQVARRPPRQRVSCKPEPQRTASRHHAGDSRRLSGHRCVAPNRKRHRIYERVVADRKLSTLPLLRPLPSSLFLQPPCRPILHFLATPRSPSGGPVAQPAHPREPVADDAAGLSYKPFRETISRTTSASPRTRASTPSGSVHHGEVAASTVHDELHAEHQRSEPSERRAPQRSHTRPNV